MARRFQDEIDAAAIANEAIMLRTAVNRTIMLVEGAKDERVFINFIDQNSCEIIISYGQENAIGALEILRRKNLAGIICVIDSDFSLFQPIIGDPDIVRTDLHDLETMMFVSPAFDKVLIEFGSEAKIANLQSDGIQPRDIIRKAAHPLGILRHYSLSRKLGMNFEGFGVNHISRQTLDVDVDEMIAQALRRSMMPPASQPDIPNYIAFWLGRRHDHWHMCCGHDLSEVFGKALQSVLGTQNAGATTAEIVERSLRLAYSWQDFVNTRLYSKIRNWEQSNAPYHCLRNA